MQLSVTQSQNKISLLKMNIVSREMHPLCLLEAEGFYELMAIVEHKYKPPSQLKSACGGGRCYYRPLFYYHLLLHGEVRFEDYYPRDQRY